MQSPTHLPPDDFPARIPACTHQQALDWSLVLASQGIEHVIQSADNGRWALSVANMDYEPARAAIRLYRLETRRWPWRKNIANTGTVFDWAGAAWVLLTLACFWLSETRDDLRALGVTDGAALMRGEWWRLFTATLLHADFAHLATNGVMGFLLIGLAMGRFGTGVGLLAAYLAGAAGNLTAWLVHGDSHRGLGASGVVMGALGLITVQWLGFHRQEKPPMKTLLGGLAGGVMLFVLFGLNPEPRTDVVAHAGGFVAGVLLGTALIFVPRLSQRSGMNLLAGAFFAAGVILTWRLALTRVDMRIQ